MFGFKSRYYSCLKLFKQLKLARADGSYLKQLEEVQKQSLLILDDLGLEPFDTSVRLSLLEILEERLRKRSIIIVSQVPIGAWHDLIGDHTIADAICDRILYSAHRIELKGESVRKIYSQKTSLRRENEQKP